MAGSKIVLSLLQPLVLLGGASVRCRELLAIRRCVPLLSLDSGGNHLARYKAVAAEMCPPRPVRCAPDMLALTHLHPARCNVGVENPEIDISNCAARLRVGRWRQRPCCVAMVRSVPRAARGSSRSAHEAASSVARTW